MGHHAPNGPWIVTKSSPHKGTHARTHTYTHKHTHSRDQTGWRMCTQRQTRVPGRHRQRLGTCLLREQARQDLPALPPPAALMTPTGCTARAGRLVMRRRGATPRPCDGCLSGLWTGASITDCILHIPSNPFDRPASAAVGATRPGACPPTLFTPLSRPRPNDRPGASQGPRGAAEAPPRMRSALAHAVAALAPA